MFSDRVYLSAAEVAERLGKSASWLYLNHRRLAEEEGFPPPAARKAMRTLKWDSFAVAAWMDEQMPERFRRIKPLDGGTDWDKILSSRLAG